MGLQVSLLSDRQTVGKSPQCRLRATKFHTPPRALGARQLRSQPSLSKLTNR